MANGADGPVAYILDQCKAYIGDLGNIGSRYVTAQTFFMSVVSALLGILALRSPNPSAAELTSPIFIAIMLLIAAICIVWRQTLIFYNHLFLTKFTVLRQMEQEGHLFPIFAREEAVRPARGLRLTSIERWVPAVIGAACAPAAVYALYYRCSHAG
jgi:hypothetical protein